MGNERRGGEGSGANEVPRANDELPHRSHRFLRQLKDCGLDVAPHVRNYAARLVLTTHPGGPAAVDVANKGLRYGTGSCLARRTVQCQLRRPVGRRPAGPASSLTAELRSPSRSDRRRPGVHPNPRKSSRAIRLNQEELRLTAAGESILESCPPAVVVRFARPLPAGIRFVGRR